MQSQIVTRDPVASGVLTRSNNCNARTEDKPTVNWYNETKDIRDQSPAFFGNIA